MHHLFNRLSLSRQFLAVSFPILLAGTLVIGWWIGRQVEDSVVHRIGGVTALYVDSFVAPHIQTLVSANDLSPQGRDTLKADLDGTALGQKIVSLKVWRKDGYVLFSTDPQAVGKTFPIDEGLAVALAGNIFSEISERSYTQQTVHGQPLPRLIETYTPIHADHTGEVIAAVEFYQRPDEVDREAGAAQRRSWLLLAGTMLVIYLCLFLVVRQGSRTIECQQSQLNQKLQQLTALHAQNQALQERVIRAAQRATTLNENFLQRVSADIHDGPGQDLGFALMQLKNICDASASPEQAAWAGGLEPAQQALESALRDLRAISADIDLPDIAPLSPCEIAARVVRDFQAKTGAVVDLQVAPFEAVVPFRVKAALYRLLQESLANTYRHAQGAGCRVDLRLDGARLRVEISDAGPGFDPVRAADKGRLGLHGMQQRVEVLGGSFALHTLPGAGTRISVSLPLTEDPADHA